MFPWQHINNIVGHIRSARTDKKEDEDGNNHHEWSVSIEGNSLDDTRFEDFIPPIKKKKKKKKLMKSTEGKQSQYGKPLLLAWLLFSNVIISTLSSSNAQLCFYNHKLKWLKVNQQKDLPKAFWIHHFNIAA